MVDPAKYSCSDKIMKAKLVISQRQHANRNKGTISHPHNRSILCSISRLHFMVFVKVNTYFSLNPVPKGNSTIDL